MPTNQLNGDEYCDDPSCPWCGTDDECDDSSYNTDEAVLTESCIDPDCADCGSYYDRHPEKLRWWMYR